MMSTAAVVEEHHAEHWEAFTGAELGAAGGVFLVANIPTVVLGGIWLHYKNRRDLREEMKRDGPSGPGIGCGARPFSQVM